MTRVDTTGDYPILVDETDPDAPFFAREADPDEGCEFPWVVIDERTGLHVAEGTLSVAADWVDRFNKSEEEGK